MNVYLVTIKILGKGRAQYEFGDYDQVLAHLRAVALFERDCPGDTIESVDVQFLGTEKEMIDKYSN